jgi:hypothetical protein
MYVCGAVAEYPSLHSMFSHCCTPMASSTDVVPFPGHFMQMHLANANEFRGHTLVQVVAVAE